MPKGDMDKFTVYIYNFCLKNTETLTPEGETEISVYVKCGWSLQG